MRNFPTLLQRRFVWNAGQWPLLVALVGVFLFCSESLFGLPLAIAALVFGLRSRFTFYSVSAVVLSVFVPIGYAFFPNAVVQADRAFCARGRRPLGAVGAEHAGRCFDVGLGECLGASVGHLRGRRLRPVAGHSDALRLFKMLHFTANV